MRIFIALLFPKTIKDKLYSYIEKMRSFYDGNYTSYDNLHLTLYYIGEIDSLLYDKVVEEIKKINQSVFEFEIGSLGSFKNNGLQRLVHCKVNLNHALESLQSRVIRALKLSGIIINSTDFTPHITLGRRVSIPISCLNEIRIEALKVKAIKVSVMESKRIDTKLVYEEKDYIMLK